MMMRRTSPFLLALLLLAAPAAMQAQFTFSTNADGMSLTITRYTGNGGAVSIPETINGLSVTDIATGAFWNDLDVTSITIPSSVTNIGEAEPFFKCPISAITVATGNAFYSSVDGVLFDKSQTTLLEFPGGLSGSYTIPNGVVSIEESAFDSCNLTSITIPGSVTTIGDYAFYNSSLTSVTISYGVTDIGAYAFSGNYGYGGLSASVTIPGSVTSIGNYAFYNSSLTNVTISYGVTSIGEAAFSGCALASVTIPGSVISIGDYAFYGCGSLANAIIANGVTSIGDGAFVLAGLISVTIPGSVTNLGLTPFQSCPLTAITVAAGNSFYGSVNGVLFDKSQSTLLEFPGGLDGSYVIPNGVASIGNEAFASGNLTNVTIPGSVTSIGYYAFGNCFHLAALTIPGSVTDIDPSALGSPFWPTSVYFEGNAPAERGGSVFAGVDGVGVAMPSDTDGEREFPPWATAYYLPGTTGWGSTFGGQPALLWNPLIETSDSGFGVRNMQFGFNITGTNNFSVVVAACTNLASPVWTPLQTVTLTNGSFYFSDPQWTNSTSRFYTLQMP
jgi:hypothetical protein